MLPFHYPSPSISVKLRKVCAPLVVVAQFVGKIDSLMRLYRHRAASLAALVGFAVNFAKRHEIEGYGTSALLRILENYKRSNHHLSKLSHGRLSLTSLRTSSSTLLALAKYSFAREIFLQGKHWKYKISVVNKTKSSLKFSVFINIRI